EPRHSNLPSWRFATTDGIRLTYAVRGVEAVGDRQDAVAEISGAFPGSPVTLVFGLTFRGDRIERLHIHPA
ncbi:hypothetical protein, partial [Pseudonocardia xishanensis]|uniref:hypothetical protein n=1 Tax=Pseudonocardia xishanensis TaxID=630995 RepID=UPI0031EB0655